MQSVLSLLSVEAVQELLLSHKYTITWTPRNFNFETRTYTEGEEKSVELTTEDWAGLEEYLYQTQSGPAVWVEGLGDVRLKAEHGGEGQGDQYWYVVEVDDGVVTRYFKVEGYYSSFDGPTFDDDLEEVSPAERTVTVWE